jgi:hypothetical protein
MAIDTAEKRRSASGIPAPPLGPGVTPNVARDAEWRQQVANGYSGIAVGAVVETAGSAAGTGTAAAIAATVAFTAANGAGTGSATGAAAAIAFTVANAAGTGDRTAEGVGLTSAEETDALATGTGTATAIAASIASAAGSAAGSGTAQAIAESSGLVEEEPEETIPGLGGGGAFGHPDLLAPRKKRKPRLIRMGEPGESTHNAEVQAEADFRTLWEAVKIRNDATRLRAAIDKRNAILADLERATLIRTTRKIG